MYITPEYYNDIFKGQPIEADMLDRLIVRASDLIDVATNYAITPLTLQPASFVMQQVQKATAAEVEYLAMFGENAANFMLETPVMQVGKFRYGLMRGGKSDGAKADLRLSQGAISYLRPTGLLYRGVDAL